MKTIKHILILSIALCTFSMAKAQVTAAFTYNLYDSCTVWQANFFDQSGTTPNMNASYTWNFGDGTTSTLQNPSHNYSSTGSYQVFHTVMFNGGTYTQLEIIQFTTSTEPIQYTYTGPTSCNSPQVYAFSSFPTNPNAQITSWSWLIDNQFAGSGPNLTYTFSNSGVYQVVVSALNASGCQSFYQESIFVGGSNLQVNATSQVLNNNCQGTYVNLYSSVFWGTAPYSYQWNWYDLGFSNAQNPQQVFLLTSVDEYAYLTVTDANGCSSSTSVFVPHQGGFISTGSTVTPTSGCGAACDGSISAVATGSIGPYIFTLNGTVQTGFQAVFNNLCIGTYSIIVEDNTGCTDVITAVVTQDSLSSILVDGIVFNGSACSPLTVCSGSIAVVASGGVAPYQYTIDFGATYQSSDSFGSLCPGTYVATVQDANGCLGEYSFVIYGTQSLGIQSSTYYASCDSNSGGQNSFISIYAYGGAAPYTYSWSNGATTSNLQNPSVGANTVIVTDANACTFSETFIVPSNQCYTISGSVYVDINGNCIFDSADYPISCFVDLTATAGGPWLWIYDYTNANGAYSINAPAGTYYFDINGSYVSNYTLTCPSAGFSVAVGPNNPTAVVDFFLTPPPPSQDLSIIMYTPYTFTPGYPTYTTVQYCNDGTITMSGNVVVEYDADLVWYQSGVTPSGYAITNNDVPSNHDAVNHILTYDFVNLQPGQCRYLDVDYETPIGTGLIPGNPILIDATVNPIPGDLTPSNNVTYLARQITSSWDPNDKAVSPEGDMTVDDNDHAYFIRFQNEGNGNANTVVVKDELDANLAIHSLRAVYASHDYIMTVENNNTLVFTFNNIQLVPLSVDASLSQGFVGFTLSQDGDLPVGTSIQNTAEIFFDFNPPIVTNTVENEIVEKTTGITNSFVERSLSVYPNPSKGIYQVLLGNNLEATSLKVYDLIGNIILMNDNINSNQAMINLENSTNGIYFLEVSTKNGKAVQKLVKEAK